MNAGLQRRKEGWPGGCDSCRYSGEEDWPPKKGALLCLRPGKYRGRVVQIFPAGRRGLIAGCAAPAWCEGFEPRNVLAARLGMNDREARKAVAEARSQGLLIMCEQNGRGYYQSDDVTEMRRQYNQDTRRVMSLLKRRKPLRDALKAAGQKV